MALAVSEQPAAGQGQHRGPSPVRSSVDAGRAYVVRVLRSPRHLSVVFLVAALGLAPITLVPRDSPTYVGMANAVPTVFDYTLAIVVAAVLLGRAAPQLFRLALAAWLPFAVVIAVLTVFFWGFSPRHVSGLLQITLALLAFGIGVVAESMEREESLLPQAFAVVAWGQLAAVLLAVMGLPLRTITGPQAIDIHGRATGLTAHPGELSKLLFFCALCALALPQRTSRERWTVWLTLGAVFVGVFLTESRTILVSVIAMVFIYMMLEIVGGRWQRKHFAVLGMTVVLGAASLPWMISRFAADPTGGARGHTYSVAGQVLADHFWVGVGPNSYVDVVGLIDHLTKTGVPVHNMFLLTAGELGVPGAALLWMPVLLVLGWAVYHTVRTRGRDRAARILVSALPGIFLIALTGWGLLQGPYFAIFLLVLGYFGARTGAPGQVEEDAHVNR
jgi:hypothetical protein